MLNAIQNWRIRRKMKILTNAQKAFEAYNFPAVYRHLAKLAKCSPNALELSFQVAGAFKRKTLDELLRETLYPITA